MSVLTVKVFTEYDHDKDMLYVEAQDSFGGVSQRYVNPESWRPLNEQLRKKAERN